MLAPLSRSLDFRISTAIVVLWIGSLLSLAGARASSAVVGTLVLFALPGLPLSRILSRCPDLHGVYAVVPGLLSGVVISAILNVGSAALVGWSPTTSAVAILSFAAALWALAGLRPRMAAGSSESIVVGDVRFLLVTSALLLLSIVIPLAHVGEVIGDQHRYYSLFAHDFLVRGAYAVSILREVPPADVFLASHPAHNYFLFHSLLAYAMSMTGHDVALENFVIAGDLLVSPLFLLTFYLLCRRCFRHALTAQVVTGIGLFAYSYEGLYVVFKRLVIPRFESLHSLARSANLLSFSDTSNGWYKDFLVEPHSVFAMTLLMAALCVLQARHHSQTQIQAHLCSGILVAGAFGSDSFVGLVGVTWLALWLINDSIVRGLAGLKHSAVAFAGCLAGILVVSVPALILGLASIGGGSSRLILAPYWTAIVLGPALFPLVLGPSLPLAGVALWLARRRPDMGHELRNISVVLLVLFALAPLGMSLLLQHSDPAHDSIVFRKAVKVMQLPLLLLSGLTAAAICADLGSKRRRYFTASTGVVILGLLTLVTDVAALSGFYDTGQTSSVSVADVRACAWLRANTPLRSVVQSHPDAHSSRSYGIFPVVMMGGRAMALANSKMARLSSLSREEYESMKGEITSLFESPSPATVLSVLAKYEIDYIYIGPHEKRNGGRALAEYASGEERFTRVYSEDDVEIYHYMR